MRLRDLDASFIAYEPRESPTSGRMLRHLDGIDGAQAVLFQCPKCAEGKPPGEPDGKGRAGAHYVLVSFANPRGAEVAPPDCDANPRWEMSGTGLDDLTLRPSINLDVGPEPRGCRWHGWVTTGEAA